MIYDYNTMELRKSLLVDLRSIGHKIRLPWILWGGFNAVLYTTDRRFRNPG